MLTGSGRRAAVAMFLAFAFAYFFSALIRAVTATLAPTLTAEFGLSARELGLLAGGFFLGFAATQLPLGSWLDRLGPRRVLLAFLVAAVAGCLAFAAARGFAGLLAARILCGVGVSACLMAPLVAFRHWLTPATQQRANSWMLMTGSLGMLAATLPVQWALPLAGWRPLFVGLAVAVVLAMGLIAWLVPRGAAQAAAPAVPAGAAPPGYGAIWRDAFFRRMAPVGFVSYGGMIAVQTLWAGPWLVRVTGLPPLAAAGGLFAINLSMLVTFWCWGWLAGPLAARGWPATRLIAWGLPLSLVTLATIVIAGSAAGAGLLALFCVSSTFVSLAQPAVGLHFPSPLAGRALSAYNLVIFAGVFVLQWGIGLAIDGFAALGLAPAQAFRCAFALLLVASAGAWAWFIAADNRQR